MKVLVTGGAGYIGATMASAFADAGDQAVLLDDLRSGSRTFLNSHPGYFGDIADRALLDGRRAGDVAGCCADIRKAAEPFGWRPQRSVVDAVRAAIRWQAHAC